MKLVATTLGLWLAGLLVSGCENSATAPASSAADFSPLSVERKHRAAERATTDVTSPDEPLLGSNPLAEPGLTTVESVVGADGGSLELGAFTLSVPPGALAQETTIRVTMLDTAAPEGFVRFSALYRIEPENIAFAAPIEVAVPFTGEPANATLLISSAADSHGYDRLRAQVDKSLAVVDLLVGQVTRGGVFLVADKTRVTLAPVESCGCSASPGPQINDYSSLADLMK